MKIKKLFWILFSLLIGVSLLLSACGGATPAPTEAPPEPEATEAQPEEPEPPASEATNLSLWYHGAGNDEERAVILQIIDDFNGSQDQWAVDIEDFPQATYNESIVAAALAGDLPDIIDMDGPVMPNWAWAGYLQPLDLASGALDGFLPGAIGEWDGETYSVGLWDAAKGMYARRSVLEDNGIRIPTLDEPWTGEEFDAALEMLQATGDFEFAFDPGMAWTGEWYPYAFSPFLQSFGGDIIDRSTMLTAEGVLNGDEAIAFGEWWQSIFERGLAPGTSQDGADRDTGFLDGKYALQWNGNWAAVPALDAFGDDMIFLPAPDFGNGPKIGAGSWQFGISADSENADGANAFIEFAIQPKYSAAFSDVLGLAPTTLEAAGMTENYAPGGPLEVFFGLSQAQALIRPPTPAYLSAALTFEKAMADIANGADVVNALDAAVDEIDADIEANDGYGFTGEAAVPSETTDLSLWYHGAGNDEERAVILHIIDDFNGSQDQWAVDIEDFPQATYNESIVAAALAGDLPDIIDMDGPVMPNWAWAGYLQPLDLASGALDGFLPGAIGEWDGETYSVGLWDAAKGMYARRSVLEDNGIRIPTLDEPWTGEEFDAALETLQATGDFEFAFDPGMAWTGEWYPYAFSPFLQSFGGDIIDRSTMLTAEGVLNGDEAIAFGEWWQSIFERGLAPGTSQDGADRDTGFLDGKYALQWNGNWAAVPALDAFGDDMIFLPTPDFGNGPKIGAGSWQFGISADSENADGANAFIEFAIQPKYSAAFSDVLGLAPTTLEAAGMTENYAPGGPLEVFFGLSQAQALIRPPTPAYLSAALTFEKAMADIANGADVINALDAAVDEIDADIEANGGYGF